MQGRIVPVPKGLWNHEGTLSFFSSGDYTSSFVETDYVQRKEGQVEVIEVPVTTVDAAVAALEPARMDWIKMDIEGSEPEAIEGALETLKRFRPDLLVESHCVKGESNADRIKELLEAAGCSVRPVANQNGMISWAGSWPEK